jgi:urease accessory protein
MQNSATSIRIPMTNNKDHALMKLKNTATLVLGLVSCLIASQGYAHHVSDGEVPVTIVEGLLSGLAHPVIGIDHLAFLILMGAAAIFTPRPLLTPLAFVGCTVVGCLMVAAGIQFPGVEIGVTVSVLIGGIMVLSGRQYSTALYVALFSVAGILHGGAYGAAIIGAQMQPLFAYLIGFACIQYAISVGVGLLMPGASSNITVSSVHPRLAGALAAGIGVALLIENIEAALVL